MKKKLKKKSGIGSKLYKTIPLSVAISLVAHGSALAAEKSFEIAVDLGSENIVKFNSELLATDQSYRQKALDILEEYWIKADTIYASNDGKRFIDFSQNAKFGKSFDEVQADALSSGDWFDNDLLSIY